MKEGGAIQVTTMVLDGEQLICILFVSLLMNEANLKQEQCCFSPTIISTSRTSESTLRCLIPECIIHAEI